MSNDENENSVERALRFTGTFESELLLELMLRYWKHPFAEDAEFRSNLLGTVSDILLASHNGETLIEGLSPEDMNFVSAVWYCEHLAEDGGQVEDRQRFADVLRRSVPGCFVDEDDIGY